MTDAVKKPQTRTTTIYDKRPDGWRFVRTEEVVIPDPADDGPEVAEGPASLEAKVLEKVRQEKEHTLEVESEFCQKVGIDG